MSCIKIPGKEERDVAAEEAKKVRVREEGAARRKVGSGNRYPPVTCVELHSESLAEKVVIHSVTETGFNSDCHPIRLFIGVVSLIDSVAGNLKSLFVF